MKNDIDVNLTKIVDLSDRNLFLCKIIDQSSIEDITKNIIKINEEDDNMEKFYKFKNFPYTRNPIKIYIDSYGGMVYQAFGLISVMDKSKTPIHTIVTGCAMSAGFMILISGHKRFAYELSTPLYHQVGTMFWGKLKELEEEYIESKRLQEMIEKIVLKNTKITKKKLKEIYDTKKDWYMTSKEAKNLSVVDEII